MDLETLVFFLLLVVGLLALLLVCALSAVDENRAQLRAAHRENARLRAEHARCPARPTKAVRHG